MSQRWSASSRSCQASTSGRAIEFRDISTPGRRCTAAGPVRVCAFGRTRSRSVVAASLDRQGLSSAAAADGSSSAPTVDYVQRLTGRQPHECPMLFLAPMENLADRPFRRALASTVGGFDEACTGETGGQEGYSQGALYSRHAGRGFGGRQTPHIVPPPHTHTHTHRPLLPSQSSCVCPAPPPTPWAAYAA